MTVKDQVKAIVEELPDDCTIEDVKYRLYVLENIRLGLEELDRGEGIPQEEAKKRMAKWLTK